MFNKAKWIWQNNSNKNDEYVYFIDEFNVQKISVFTLNISCDTNYTVYINGRLAAFGQYADYPYYKVYDQIDITEFVLTGKNRIAICGYYQGSNFSTHYCNKAAIIYEILQDNNIIAFSNENTKSRIATDYASHNEIILTNQLGYIYDYDMSEYDGWNLSDYDYSEFSNSVLVDNMPGKLHIRPLKKLILDKPVQSKIIKAGSFTYNGGITDAEKQQNAIINYDAEITGKKITVKQNGIFALYDLGREEVGFLYLEIRTKEKTNISIGYGEHITDGRVRTYIEDRNFAIGYKAKKGEQQYINTFTRFAGRYLQLFAQTDELEIEQLSLSPVYYPLTEKRFTAQNSLRQKIYDTSVRTLRLCMHEHYEDCPWREQAFYSFDSRNQMLFGYYAFNETEMARASLKLIGLDNREDNLLSICYPSKFNLAIPSFSLYYIISMYEYMYYTNDKTLCIEFFDKMQSIINVFISRIKNGLVPIFSGSSDYWNFYEWTEGLQGNLFKEDKENYDLILNALYSLALSYMIKICKSINKKENISLYEKLINNINKQINSNFYDSKKGLYFTSENSKNFTELGNSLAILCGAADLDKQKQIAEILTNNDNEMIKITLSMLFFKYDALLITDKDKYKDYILNDIDKNYSRMLEKGATSFWETIKGEADFDGAGSLCHGWSALPVYYFNIL